MKQQQAELGRVDVLALDLLSDLGSRRQAGKERGGG